MARLPHVARRVWLSGCLTIAAADRHEHLVAAHRPHATHALHHHQGRQQGVE